MKSNRFIISSFFLFGFCLLLISFSFFSIFTGASTYSCKSLTGADVDWFLFIFFYSRVAIDGGMVLYTPSKFFKFYPARCIKFFIKRDIHKNGLFIKPGQVLSNNLKKLKSCR